MPYRTIADALNRGDVVPFLGSAASIAERREAWDRKDAKSLPTTRELAHHVARAAGLSPPLDEWDDLAKVSSYYRHVVGDREDLSHCLREVLDRRIAPSFRIHRTLAALDKVRLILTTNYDSLVGHPIVSEDDELPSDQLGATGTPDEEPNVANYGDEAAT